MMTGKRAPAIVAVLAVFVAGCNQNREPQIVMLEEANRRLERSNRTLNEQLDQAHAELAAARRDLRSVRKQLSAATVETQALRERLATAPAMQILPPSAPAATLVASLEGDIFQPGQATLKTGAESKLDEVAERIRQQFADKDILILGHTDNIPIRKSGWEDNHQLSTERALTVLRHLRDRGIPATRLIAAGCGESRPRTSNETAAGRAANRRVEIHALDNKTLKH
jgi:flagellar motor protein MotB